MSESDATRGGVAGTSRMLVGLAWASLVTGGLLVWLDPRPSPLVDILLAPLAAVLLYHFVERWTDPRGAWTAVVVALVIFVVSLTFFREVPGALATRNLAISGSAQLMVGLASLLLLQWQALPPMAWSVLLIIASGFHPQYAFVPLLMITIVEWRTVLVGSFIARARGAALRCAGLSVLVLWGLKLTGLGGVPDDAVTLPLAWWLASWLLDGQPLMPVYIRALVAGILCVSTVQDFRPWPAMAVVLLVAWLLSARRQQQQGGLTT